MVNKKVYKQNIIPRYRGFNLLGMFVSEDSKINFGRSLGYFCEEDFKMISNFGFNYVRLPLSYRVWSSADNPYKIDEEKIRPLDDAISYGIKYGLHVCICLHRIPGFCVNNDEEEPYSFWYDDEALNAAKYQWCEITKRYKHIPSKDLSFNIVNEPKHDIPTSIISLRMYAVAQSIREISPDRLIVFDGAHNGSMPPMECFHIGMENCIYSCRGYSPGHLTHYGIDWVPDKTTPKWPNDYQTMGDVRINWNREKIDEYFDMWSALSNVYNRGVICGEFGCYNNTPHEATLAWFEDMLQSLKEHNIGYALWNFRGPFGIMDSGRTDVDYIDYNGHKLDEKLLKLLQNY